MNSRLAHLLLVAVLLLGQFGGYLHETLHHAGVSGQPVTFDASMTGTGSNPASPVDSADHCLLCLSFAALGIALPGLALVLALLTLRFALPASAVLLPAAFRRLANQARGPPVFS